MVTGAGTTDFEFAVRYGEAVDEGVLDGRILLLISDRDDEEPRFQVRPDIKAIEVLGVDVEEFHPGAESVIGADTFGFPIRSIADLTPGDYVVQAVLHRYETFRLATGHTVKLPMDRGEGQSWGKAPGNLYSRPERLQLDPRRTGRVELTLDQVIPPIDSPADSVYVRHIRVLSQRLTEFWGRPMYLAPTCCCRTASTNIRRHGIRCLSSTAIFRLTSAVFARHRRIRIWCPITASVFRSRATTLSNKRRRMPRTGVGSGPVIRG